MALRAEELLQDERKRRRDEVESLQSEVAESRRIKRESLHHRYFLSDPPEVDGMLKRIAELIAAGV